MRIHFLIPVVAAAFLSISSVAGPIPVEAFTDNQAIASPRLSADGKQVVYLAASAEKLALADFHRDTGNLEVICMVDSHTDGFALKGDDRILFTDVFGGIRYLRSVSPGRTSVNKFTQFGDRRQILNVVNWLPADPGHILVRGIGSAAGRIGKLDVKTGAIENTEPIEANDFVGPYIADTRGTLRLRCIQNRDRIVLQQRSGDQDGFRDAYSWGWGEPSVYFEGFGPDPDICFLRTQTGNDLGELRTFDLRTSTFGPVVATYPDGVVRDAIFSRNHERLVGVGVEGAYGWEQRWLDAGLRHTQAAIDASLPGRYNQIAGWSADEKVFLILSSVGANPGEYFILDEGRRSLSRFGSVRPALDGVKLSTPIPMEIKARDGFVIHAVLTPPIGSSKGPWPMIIKPVEDPFHFRSNSRYADTREFLASRGYATLDVDYRGSWGYGLAYERAGFHEFAGKILDDIEDAAEWTVQSGYARQGHIAIMGTDLGAALALIEAVQHPDEYCCVINDGGIPDASLLVSPNYDWLTRKKLEIGFGTDKAALAKVSVLDSIERLKAPLLNIYPIPDRNLVWGKLEMALNLHGKPYTLLKNLDWETRPSPRDQRRNYFEQVEAFLASNLPAN